MSDNTAPATAGPATAGDPAERPDPRRWRILWLVGIAQLMLILDVTVVAIALPHLATDLGLDRATLTWVVSGYTLAFGGLLLLGGRAADLFGARRLVLLGLGLFALASLVAGLASSGPMLLGGRLAQGLAAAILSPAALSVVVTTFEGDERNRALGIWSALGGSGAALGVLLGGVLTAGPGWPWVFIVNVPVGIVLLLTLRTHLPAHPRPAAGGRLDVLGAALVTAATGSLIYALVQAGDGGWATPTTAAFLLAALVLYGGFVARQLTATSPLMDLRLLTRRPVATGTVLILVATALMIMVFFLGTFFLQHHQSYGPLVTGLLFLPVAIATMVGANVAGRVLGRVGPRLLGVVGLLVAAAGMSVPAMWEGTTAMVVGVSVAAAGTGIAFVVASATALGQVEPQEAGLASGIVSTFHEFGASVGAALASSVAAASLVGPGSGTSTVGFDRGFTTGAVIAVVAALVTLVITPSTRRVGAGRRR
ncbi:major facilitator superfamily MFS_1 [Beutenbergia cavernae DSM 12333]|uniref:Major facilitator superfamily MFS_1 n=1 Tax=Beutenbergia cavernae (strain ATCC BAA-8 / DSM 12333 / CCUG 43141 / JCM 11478 / NBRC 16432 / NCIMB 13614 / HKI 0122) TaxID=471853 RepID=C5BWU4_BEUC1|nr:MFS transporter [Beutenbergia cavernae]ACQ80760.1 major facilitator superfamily MFS_1 [Beutenbergia cavernae DSM 12333]